MSNQQEILTSEKLNFTVRLRTKSKGNEVSLLMMERSIPINYQGISHKNNQTVLIQLPFNQRLVRPIFLISKINNETRFSIEHWLSKSIRTACLSTTN